jgi:hypothetical protein
MNEEHFWVAFNGPEPEHVRPLLAALRERPPAPAAERESFIDALMSQLDRPENPVPREPVARAPVPPAPPPVPPAPPPVPPPLLHTAPMPAMPSGAPSPFLPPGAFPARVPAPLTKPCPVMKVGTGTTPSGDSSIERAVAAVRSGKSKPAVVVVPALSLAHYAWLCAEMAVWPEYPDDIRRRYQVLTPAVHQALDAQWRERAAADPGVRAELTRLYWEYVGWLRARRARR